MRWVALSLAGLMLACAHPISTQMAAKKAPPKVTRIAVRPFSDDLTRGGNIAPGAAAIVTARVVDALSRAGDFEIIPPDQAATGADAVLTGVVGRYVERVGGPNGAFKPASVAFKQELRTPDGQLIWSGTFDETQRSLSEDLGSLGRAWSRSFKWVTAAALAVEGADELASALGEDLASWS